MKRYNKRFVKDAFAAKHKYVSPNHVRGSILNDTFLELYLTFYAWTVYLIQLPFLMLFMILLEIIILVTKCLVYFIGDDLEEVIENSHENEKKKKLNS